MFKKVTTLVAVLLILGFAFNLTAQDWGIVKQFDFNDQLDQLVVLNQEHGYLLVGHSLWEFTGHPAVWTQKTELPVRMDPANPGENLSYNTYRMIAWGDTIVVVASKGSIFYSTDAAANWTDISDTAYIDVAFEWVHGTDLNHFWVCGGTSSPKKGYVIKVENLTLTRQDNEEMDYKLSQICFTDLLHGHAAAGGTKGDYFRTEDGGNTWTKIAGHFLGGTSGRVYQMQFASQNVGYAAAYYGYLYKTTDGGASVWEQIETPENAVSSSTQLLGLCVLSEQELWVSGKEGRIYYSNDGGASFTTYQIPSGNNFDSIWFCSSDMGIAMAPTQIFHAYSGGTSWKPITNWVRETWSGAAVVGEDKLCLVTGDGMYSYGPVDNIAYPRIAIPDNYRDLKNAYSIDGKLFMMGSKIVLLSEDDGVTWTDVVNADSGLAKTVYDMTFVDADTGYFCDSGGNIWKTTDGGYNWVITEDIGGSLYRVIFPDYQTGYALPYKDEQILKTTDGGSTWTPYTITEIKSEFQDMEIVEGGALIVAGYDATTSGASIGYILRSTDGGETWTTVFYDKLSYESLRFYSVEFNGLVGYASGNYGVILKTEDGGETWAEDTTPIAGLSELSRLYDTTFLPNGDVYVVGAKGYVLKNSTGSGVWVVTSDLLKDFTLNQNYPNPFNPSTGISYYLPKTSNVSLEIFNATGQKITTLVQGKQNAGSHSISWNAANASSGVYFCRLKTDGITKTKKMLLLR